MNVLHTITSLEKSAGGPSLSTTLTVRGLRELDIDAEILTYDAFSSGGENILEEDYIHFLPTPREQKFAYSKVFTRFLEQTRYDLYHAQGIWQYPAYITAKKARKFDIPYVITPHGMLYPQEFGRSGFRKKIALALYQKKHLQQAASVHATCTQEMQHLRALGITAPVAVIPNPIETNPFLGQKINSPNKLRFGYLGRIHPRKKIEAILHAWERLGESVTGAELVIIGDGDKKYYTFLKAEAKNLNLTNVDFTGFLSGEAKERKLASLSYLVVASDFENFGMIIPEALVRGIPVIASKGTPWQDLQKYDCGWWVENDIETLTKKMEEAIHLPETNRIEMARRGKGLIRKKYTVCRVAKKMKAMYAWILGNSAKPDYIYLSD